MRENLQVAQLIVCQFVKTTNVYNSFNLLAKDQPKILRKPCN